MLRWNLLFHDSLDGVDHTHQGDFSEFELITGNRLSIPMLRDERHEHPTGRPYLMKDSSENFHLIIDTLLSVNNREFTKSELAEAAGVSRHTVRAQIGKLLELGIIRTVASGKRYRFNLDSPVTQEICERNSAVNAVGAGHVEIDPDTGAVSDSDE